MRGLTEKEFIERYAGEYRVRGDEYEPKYCPLCHGGKNKDKYTFGLNYKKLSSIVKEKCVLAEELGHYYYDAIYTLNSDSQLISKQEYKAMKWRSLNCVSLNSLLSCFRKRNI